ncbi:GyrI-like domain-containing protein [Chloroflexota bacterium]
MKDIAPRTVVYLKCRGSWRQLPDMVARLNGYVSRSSLTVTGSASGVYHNTPDEASVPDLEWEVFYQVEAETPESGNDKDGFGIRYLPEVMAASIIHRGSYRKAGSSYRRLEEWIRREGFEVCGPSEEVYLAVFDVPSEGQIIEIRLPVRPSVM